METPFILPEDINIEVLLACLPEKSYRLKMGGMHHRNVTHDVLSFEKEHDGAYAFTVGRSSLYDMMPEVMFHPIDRFKGIVGDNQEKAFKEELARQEEEITQAQRFFAPFDVLLLKLRTEVREEVRQKTEGNQALIDVLFDPIQNDVLCKSIHPEWRSNRFIRSTLMFVPHAKRIRGNNTFLSLMLRKIFFNESLNVKVKIECCTLEDKIPRYQHRLDGKLGEGFVGTQYEDVVPKVTMIFWLDKECREGFNTFLDELETFRRFVQYCFVSLEQQLVFDVSTIVRKLFLSDDKEHYHYLGYNTNL